MQQASRLPAVFRVQCQNLFSVAPGVQHYHGTEEDTEHDCLDAEPECLGDNRYARLGKETMPNFSWKERREYVNPVPCFSESCHRTVSASLTGAVNKDTAS